MILEVQLELPNNSDLAMNWSYKLTLQDLFLNIELRMIFTKHR